MLLTPNTDTSMKYQDLAQPFNESKIYVKILNISTKISKIPWSIQQEPAASEILQERCYMYSYQE